MQYKLLILLFAGLISLSGCGLETEEDEDKQGLDISALEQHSLLPLTDGSALVYSDSLLNQVVANVERVNQDSGDTGPLHQVEFTNQNLNLGLLIRTSTSKVEWLGINGPINVSQGVSNFTLESLRFDNPIVIIGNGNHTGTTTASIVTDNDQANASTPTVSYRINNSNSEYDNAGALYGPLPTLRVNIVSDIEIKIGIQTVLTLSNLTTQLSFATGIGIVQFQSDFQGGVLNSDLTNLRDLPQTIWYQYNDGNPILANGSSATVMIDNSPVLGSRFDIYNQDELDQLDWLTVSLDPASDSYQATVTYSENLPNQLTSVQVIFQDRENPERLLSGNITLLN